MKEEILSTFAVTLKSLRKERKLRQADLSQALGLSQATIANYEQGTRFPDEAVLNRLADYLGVSTDILLGRQSASRNRTLALVQTRQEAKTEDLDRMLGWLLSGNFSGFQSALDQLIGGGMSVAEVHVGVIQPLMYEVGRRWENGQLDVYQEHAVSEQVKQHVARLSIGAAVNSDGPRFLGFAVSGNLHDLGIRMVVDILQLSGWNSLYLGSNLPPSSVLAAVRDFRPGVIGISAALDQHIGIVQQTIYYLRQELKEDCPPIMVGGYVFTVNPDLASALGADAVALDGIQALKLAKTLLEPTVKS